jgi:methylated-DNA-[protein]-cysteine S-methyltransferase
MRDTDPRRRPGPDDALLAAALAPPEPGELAALREALATRAAAAGLLDVAYRLVDSPVGTLLLAATDAGLVRVAFAIEGFEAVLDDLAEQISPRLLAGSARLEAPARELDEYFDGHRQTFDLELDLRLSSGFRRSVVERLAQIPYGQHTSYGALAAQLERPRASRAVGTACATNPLPVILPCHRVLRADGSLGGYLGGTTAKRWLLDHEHAA